MSYLHDCFSLKKIRNKTKIGLVDNWRYINFSVFLLILSVIKKTPSYFLILTSLWYRIDFKCNQKTMAVKSEDILKKQKKNKKHSHSSL